MDLTVDACRRNNRMEATCCMLRCKEEKGEVGVIYAGEWRMRRAEVSRCLPYDSTGRVESGVNSRS
jgi:hypothetical protein